MKMHKGKYLILGFVLMVVLFVVLFNISFALADDDNETRCNTEQDCINSGKCSPQLECTCYRDKCYQGYVSAKNNDSNDDEDDDNNGGMDRNRTKIRTREIITRDGCTIKIEKEVKIENGRRVEIVKRKMVCADGTKEEVKLIIENITEDGRFRERIRYEFKGEELEVEAEDGINLSENTTGNEYRLRAKLRNGNFTDIKIMPDTASEIALARLRAHNFTIQLREKIHKNIPRVVYNIEANKSGRFLGIFKFAMKVEGEVDPETGEFLGISKPWWAFLIVEQDETGTGDKKTLNLTEQNDSNQSGTATLTEEDGQVIVNLSMVGAPVNVSQPVHIHMGNCSEIDEIKYPLTNLLNGESVTTINATFAQLQTELPLAINVHQSVENSSVYVSCGNIQF